MLNYPMNNMPGLIQQPLDFPSSYWGNLAQFGLFPNGRGGVAPGPCSGPEPSGMRPQNLAVGKYHISFFTFRCSRTDVFLSQLIRCSNPLGLSVTFYQVDGF